MTKPPPPIWEESHGMVWPENIDSGHSNSQLDGRSGRRHCNLAHLHIHARSPSRTLSRPGSKLATVDAEPHHRYRIMVVMMAPVSADEMDSLKSLSSLATAIEHLRCRAILRAGGKRAKAQSRKRLQPSGRKAPKAGPRRLLPRSEGQEVARLT